jgi:hypothetical protein
MFCVTPFIFTKICTYLVLSQRMDHEENEELNNFWQIKKDQDGIH